MSLSVVLVIILGSAMVPVVYWDGRWRLIPNFITLPLIALGIAGQVMLHGVSGLWLSLTGLLLGALLMLPFYLLNGMGAGDLKLMAAVGAVLGLRWVLTVFFFTSLVGGLLAAILLLVHRSSFRTSRLPSLESQPDSLTVPYGWAIAAGTWLTIFIHRAKELL
jgi:prepilin peptidase CpaA